MTSRARWTSFWVEARSARFFVNKISFFSDNVLIEKRVVRNVRFEKGVKKKRI